MAIETPKYEVVLKKEGFEIRKYPPYVTIETMVSGEFESAGNKGFRILLDYISGNNQKKQKMEMTAPVEQKAVGEKISMTAPVEFRGSNGNYTLAFVLPGEYTSENTPLPNDSRITVIFNKPRIFLAWRFSGFWSESNYNENLDKVKNFIVKEKITTMGEPIYARYNSPFSIWFLRRNEILQEINFQK